MRRTIAILLAAGLLVAAGCGDDNEETGSTTPSTGAVSPGESDAGDAGANGPGGGTKVSLTEFKIDPSNPSVKAGSVSFEVTNGGQVPHALEIEGNGVEEETDVLQGGDTAELQANLKPGKYEWYCPVGDHRSEGMEGTLTVK
ncbi:MAG TPA: cupredoxin domain-containing protein [Solirubrobacteraceae bacterium]|jgi:plastocyanin